MESKTNRYQSRILREMHQNTENPFNSPPSSTGSHGTVTLTSNITMGPQGESTRRMDDLSIKLPSHATMRNSKAPQPSSLNINTSALGRAFPEWSRWNPNGPEHDSDHDKDMWETASDGAPNPEGKENVTPHGSPNSSIVATPRAEESGRDKVSKHFLDHMRYLRAKLREPVPGLEVTRQKMHAVAELAHEMAEDGRLHRAARATHNAQRKQSLLSSGSVVSAHRGCSGRLRPGDTLGVTQRPRNHPLPNASGSYLRSRRKDAIAAAQHAYPFSDTTHTSCFSDSVDIPLSVSRRSQSRTVPEHIAGSFRASVRFETTGYRG